MKHDNDLKTLIFNVIYIEILLAALCFGGMLLLRYYSDLQSERYYENLRKNLTKIESSDNAGEAPDPNPAIPNETGSNNGEPFALTPEQKRALSHARYGYDDSKEIISDIKAWIYIPAAGVDHPVMQGKDNIYYLNHLPDGSFSNAGSLFLDYRFKDEDKHRVIFGHNMNNGSMFGELDMYLKEDFYEKNRFIYLYDGKDDFVYKIFSVAMVKKRSDAYDKAITDAYSYDAYIDRGVERSIYPVTADDEFYLSDGLLTLSTCRRLSDTSRLVISAYRINSKT